MKTYTCEELKANLNRADLSWANRVDLSSANLNGAMHQKLDARTRGGNTHEKYLF